MSVAVVIASVLLAIGAVGAVVRILVGPSVADRMVALDSLLFIGVGGVGVFIVNTGDVTYVSVLVVAVLTAFLGTVVVARYIEAETKR